MDATPVRMLLPIIVVSLSVVAAGSLFKCVAVFECSKKPCKLLKQSTVVDTIDGSLLKDVYEEIKVQSFKEPTVLFKGSVRNLHSLERLRLSSAKIARIEAGAFVDLPNLELLDLRRNLLQKLPNGVFNFLNVTELQLQGNKIKEIESGAFDDMEYLEVVSLDNNNLAALDPNWFKNTPNVQYLSLKQNRIEIVPYRAFGNIKGEHVTDDGDVVFTDIYLNKNRIHNIEFGAFENLHVLGDLYLSNNKLTSLDGSIFENLTNLEVLSLSRNKLNVLSSELRANITRVDLSHNKLKCVPYSFVKNVKKTILTGNKRLNCRCLKELLVHKVVKYDKRQCPQKKKKKKKRRNKRKKTSKRA